MSARIMVLCPNTERPTPTQIVLDAASWERSSFNEMLSPRPIALRKPSKCTTPEGVSEPSFRPKLRQNLRHCGAAVALVLAACSGAPLPASSPVGPLAPSAVGDVALSGVVLGQFDDLPQSGLVVTYQSVTVATDSVGRFSVPGIPTTKLGELTIAGPGILPRTTYTRTVDGVWKVAPADFDTGAYDDVAREFGLSMRWKRRPVVYIDTRPRGDLSPEDVALWTEEVRRQAKAFVRSWSAGTVRPVVRVTSEPPAIYTGGTIIIHFSEDPVDYDGGRYIGYTRMTWNGRMEVTSAGIWLRYRSYRDNPAKRQGLLGHELGHTFGYRHMDGDTRSLMEPSIGSKTDLKPFDWLAAEFLYGRFPGNVPLDSDPRYGSRIKLAAAGYWEGP